MQKRSVLSIVLASVLVLGAGGYSAHAVVTAQETDSIRASAAEAEQTAAALAADTSAERSLAERTKSVAGLESARDARGDFVIHIGAAKEVLGAAAGKVDAAPYRQRVLDAQQAVLKAKDSSTVQEQTAAVEAAAVELAAVITEFDNAARKAAEEAAAKAAREKQAAKSSSSGSSGSSGSGGASKATSSGGKTGNGGGGGGGGGGASGGARANVNDNVGRGGGPTSGEWWFQEMRQALNDAGGGRFALSVYDGNCGGTWAYACADYTRGIMVHPDIASTPDYYRAYVARHELAHIFQYRIYYDLMPAPGYARVFGSNIELLADCMVAQRFGGYTTYSCSGEQTAWAAGIWDGVIPG